MGFPCGSEGKESTRNAGDMDSIPGLGGSPREGHSNLLQYSCLENPMDRGALADYIVHGVSKESDTTEQLTHTYLLVVCKACTKCSEAYTDD